ncbi:MAG: bifunctional diguanylate cyclase/phosphodiesterase [Lachnospiraceae bacterium]|nr:bifunctional diguanylate cyclase/phosphodiesterase [Lachnospiraceae bacterium]
MQWNMDFELSALVVLLVVGYLQLRGCYVPIKRSRIFLAITILEGLTVVCNVVSKGLLYYLGLDKYISTRPIIDVYYMLQYGVAVLIMAYLIAWSGRRPQKNKLSGILFLLPVVVYLEEVIRNFATHHLYTYSGRFGYLETDAINVLNGVAAYCILYGVVYCVVHERFNTFGRLTTMAGLGLAMIVAVFLQQRMPDVVFVDFAMAMVLLIVYFVAQNPSEMLDYNTQILNRNMMEELLGNDIVAGRSFEIIVLDLDDFRFVNKTFGVAVCDMLLMQVAHFLTSLAGMGSVYRYGDDRFAVQLKDEIQREKMLEQLHERFRHPWITEDVSVMLSTTISCISCPEDGDQLETIIDVIDYSVLLAKRAGKGGVVYAKDMDLHAMRKEQAIEQAVEMAIERDTIEVYYQPIFNTEKQAYTSAEALVRIHDDLLGNISPEIFIPIAERNGSIVKLGTMIFEKVCRFISEQNLEETSIEYIEINVSVVQCIQSDFVDTLNEIMDRYHVRPEQINLEITETAASNSFAILQENVERLYQQGISFSLDDYGSGYATIGYIHRFPFCIIKLDKLMVWDAFENERAGITLKHTVGMLKELKMHIVAEGVETDEQQNKLSDIGCDYLQGWYYSKAVSEQEFVEIIKEAC